MTACNSGQGFGFGDGDDGQDGYLTIYVYTPGNPIPTRSDERYQSATEDEKKIHTLQLWVFKHTADADDGELVGYMNDVNVDLTAGKTYQVVVSRDFSDHPTSVDVYAVANVAQANAGHTFTRQTTRAQLDAATLSGDCFGVASDKLVQSVPSDGLPMTGVLKDQGVVGTFPALRIVDKSDATQKMAEVNLVRSISKLRFVICRSDGTNPNEQLYEITGITLDAEMIPQKTYLMLNEPYDRSLKPTNPLADSRIHIVPGAYEGAVSFGSVKSVDTDGTTVIIPVRADDLATPDYKESAKDWLFDAVKPDGTARYADWEAYANAIEQGIANYRTPTTENANERLYEYGLTYLRESDKKITGTVTYKTKDWPSDAERTATFEMDVAGDFSRNHTWTVMLLFEGGKLRTINVVDVGVRSWHTASESDHDVYNW
jgi:hypothetical protein